MEKFINGFAVCLVLAFIVFFGLFFGGWLVGRHPLAAVAALTFILAGLVWGLWSLSDRIGRLEKRIQALENKENIK